MPQEAGAARTEFDLLSEEPGPEHLFHVVGAGKTKSALAGKLDRLGSATCFWNTTYLPGFKLEPVCCTGGGRVWRHQGCHLPSDPLLGGAQGEDRVRAAAHPAHRLARAAGRAAGRSPPPVSEPAQSAQIHGCAGVWQQGDCIHTGTGIRCPSGCFVINPVGTGT